MANAKELVKSKKVILVYGPTGTGKTTLFTSIPGKKFIYMFDPSGLDSIAGCDIEYEAYFDEPILGIRATQKGRTDPKAPKQREPTAYARFEDSLEERLASNFKGYDVIGIDSLTTLQIITMDRILWLNGRLGRVPEIADYMLVGETIMAILRAICSLPNKIVYITGHSDLVQDEISKRVQNQFDITKNIRRLLPRLCSDVWVSGAEQGKDSVEYYVQTSPSRDFPSAKNSFGLRQFEDVTMNLRRPREEQGIGKWLKQHN